ncbi:UGSC family (seleno)protein [Microbacterium sp. zg.B48]|uniref:UGSC family (seleno)protein n=1 Tax=unclassified Microbacterium TaxID=2609290 RepID=UPI00214C7932|nr:MULTISPECIES: UGSC family (seleno)protein [unclassified Microbacterium]MCR2763060.1 UGSC family (seleno)protein [Microbacterium sp. zg.B48]MCR2808625.1 UGSC family (seleno)protein [Microbacterium sp. zg.B185]WIM18941.1 UGSC family (seleno)protein [Microbacterium sp. zg-B185]
MATQELLLDPTGMEDGAQNSTLSPRPVSLRGLTIGLLDNTKPNSTMLLNEIARELQDHHGAGESRLYTKDYFGTPLSQELLEEIAGECDVVITAVGDCGSCSAATVADGILLERAGVPTVSITSDSFLMSGAAMASVQGFPGFDFYAVKHPMASLNADEVRERALTALPDVLRILGVEG